MKPTAKRLLTLFFSTLSISACTFGGGFVIITFMKKRFVDELHWLEEQEMLDIIALSQTSPGAVAVNCAILTGWKVAGLPGMVFSTLGCVIPPLVILSLISVFYGAFADNRFISLLLSGMQAGVAAVILDVVCNMGWKLVKSQNTLSVVLMPLAFAAVYFFKVSVVYVLLAAAAIGALKLLLLSQKTKKGGERL